MSNLIISKSGEASWTQAVKDALKASDDIRSVFSDMGTSVQHGIEELAAKFNYKASKLSQQVVELSGAPVSVPTVNYSRRLPRRSSD